MQYRQIDDECEEWAVMYADFQHLKTATTHEYFNGQYLHTNETRRFETLDGQRHHPGCAVDVLAEDRESLGDEE